MAVFTHLIKLHNRKPLKKKSPSMPPNNIKDQPLEEDL